MSRRDITDEKIVVIDMGLPGIGFIVWLVLLILKLCKVINIGWFWVWFPLWLPIAISLVILIVAILLCVLFDL